jgi:O-methyltransferase/8-demethyl-8-(2,3-dimethoxy-alpha-L-rhamnosyl)tetracenomycin-C 4'-O-methyltransferase
MKTTELYADLLIRIVANTIYRDPPMDPWHGQVFTDEARTTGGDWPSVAHSMVGVKRLQNLAKLVQSAIDEGIEGDFIETGVWRGGCCILMRGILKANGVDRKVYVADSFAGLPPPNEEKYPQDKGDTHHLHDKSLAVSLEQVKSNFDAYGLLDDSVVFIKGYFQQTLATLPDKPFALIRLDGDMYESTIIALEALYPKLSVGGYAIIDDYGVLGPCRQAVTDYRQRHGITSTIHQIDESGIWWRKT